VRLRTLAVVASLLAVLAGIGALGIAASGGRLDEAWVSDTTRDNERNHHAAGVGPNGSVVVAPVADVPVSDGQLPPEACSLVRLDAGDGGVNWRVTVPRERCFTHALTRPAVEDLDGDGGLEVAVASTQDALVVYDATDGSEQWRVATPTYGYGQPAIADLLGAPGKEVIASDIEGNVAVAHANGSVAWRRSLDGTLGDRFGVYASPRVKDLDGDGGREVLLGTTAGAAVLDADGSVRWHRDERATYLVAAPADDGEARTVFASGHDGIRAYDGADGDQEWALNGSNARIGATVTVDGRTLLLAGVFGGEVVAIEADTGQVAWTSTVVDEDVTVPPPIAADVNGDGTLEVVALAEDGTVMVLEADSGSELAAYERRVPIWTTAVPADLDGDGAAEFLVTYGDGRVVALEYDPSPLSGVFG
jgi:outer membrane protein assembly factor BamB